MKKLKQTEIKKIRDRFYRQQDGMCPLCDREMEDFVLDHDHSTGHCRSTLCRLCNSLEGKIENWIRRYGKGVDRVLFIKNLIQYWEKDYSRNPLHYKHKTETDKQIQALRRRAKMAKRKSTREKISKQIKDIKNGR